MMYYLPEWKIYVCQYVMTIEKEKSNNRRVSLDIVLIHADSPEKAYEKAKSFIECNHNAYKDDDGKLLVVRCHGIHDIELLQDTWEEIQEVSQNNYGYDVCSVDLPKTDSIEKLITMKEGLSIFL